MPGKNNTKVYYKLEKDQMVITLAGLGGDLKSLEESLKIYKKIYEEIYEEKFHCNESDFKIVPCKDKNGQDVYDQITRQQFYIQLPDNVTCVNLGGMTDKSIGEKCHIKLGEIFYNTHVEYGERIISIVGIPDLKKIRLKRELNQEFILKTLKEEIAYAHQNKTGTDRHEHMVWVNKNAKTFLTYLKENLFKLEYSFQDKPSIAMKSLLNWLVQEKILENSSDNPNKYLCTYEALERLKNFPVPYDDCSDAVCELYDVFSQPFKEVFEHEFDADEINTSKKTLLEKWVQLGVLKQDSSNGLRYTITKDEVQRLKIGRLEKNPSRELVELHGLFCSFLPEKPFEFTLPKQTPEIELLLRWLMDEQVVTKLDSDRYSFTKDALQHLFLIVDDVSTEAALWHDKLGKIVSNETKTNEPFEFTLSNPPHNKLLLEWLIDEKVVTRLGGDQYSFTNGVFQKLQVVLAEGSVFEKAASLCKQFTNQPQPRIPDDEAFYKEFCKLPIKQQLIHYVKWMFANSFDDSDLWENIKKEFEKDKRIKLNDDAVLAIIQHYFTSPESRNIQLLKKCKMAAQVGSTLLHLPRCLTDQSFRLPLGVPGILSNQEISEIFGQKVDRDLLFTMQENDESVENPGQLMATVNLWYQHIVDYLYPETASNNNKKSTKELGEVHFGPAINSLLKLGNADNSNKNEAIEPLPAEVITKLLATDDFRKQSATAIVSGGIQTAYPVAAIFPTGSLTAPSNGHAPTDSAVQNSNNGGSGKILYVQTSTGDKPSAVSFTQENGITYTIVCYWDGSILKVGNVKDLKLEGNTTWGQVVSQSCLVSPLDIKRVRKQQLPGLDSHGNLFDGGEILTETNPKYYVGQQLNGLQSEIFQGIYSNIPEAEQRSFGDGWTIADYSPGDKPDNTGKFLLHRPGNRDRKWIDPDTGKVVDYRADLVTVPEEKVYPLLGDKPKFKLSSAKGIRDSLMLLSPPTTPKCDLLVSLSPDPGVDFPDSLYGKCKAHSAYVFTEDELYFISKNKDQNRWIRVPINVNPGNLETLKQQLNIKNFRLENETFKYKKRLGFDDLQTIKRNTGHNLFLCPNHKDSLGDHPLTQIADDTIRANAYGRMWQQFTEKHDSALDVAKAFIADYRDHSLQNDDEIVAEVSSEAAATSSNGTAPEIAQTNEKKGVIAKFINKIKNILKSFGHWGRHHHQDAVELLKKLNALPKNANDNNIYDTIVLHREELLKRSNPPAEGAAAVSKKPQLKQGGSYDARLSTLIAFFGSRSLETKTVRAHQQEVAHNGQQAHQVAAHNGQQFDIIECAH
jgi:hypothetical protein